ncbi:MAG: YheV family putative metal-binding protein [Pseudomonadales bacterium]|nr:YheV family putative metal-binding protein [Pseudomonadales bacterium]
MLKRRFIAGAQCPKCEQVDKIVMYDHEDGFRYRECVACGFKDQLDAHDNTPQELGTRVNQNRLGEQKLPHETEVQVVNLLDPKKLH